MPRLFALLLVLALTGCAGQPASAPAAAAEAALARPQFYEFYSPL